MIASQGQGAGKVFWGEFYKPRVVNMSEEVFGSFVSDGRILHINPYYRKEAMFTARNALLTALLVKPSGQCEAAGQYDGDACSADIPLGESLNLTNRDVSRPEEYWVDESEPEPESEPELPEPNGEIVPEAAR